MTTPFSADFMDAHLALLLEGKGAIVLTGEERWNLLRKTNLFDKMMELSTSSPSLTTSSPSLTTSIKKAKGAFELALKDVKLQPGKGQDLAMLLYSNGQYKEAQVELYKLPLDQSNLENVLWLKLQTLILLERWQGIFDLLMTLEKFYVHGSGSGGGGDVTHASSGHGNSVSQKELLLKRAWWLQLSLFTLKYLTYEEKMVISEVYRTWLNVIQTSFPPLQRYLAYLILLNKKLHLGKRKEIARIVKSDGHLYSDPLTRLLHVVLDVDFQEVCKDLKDVKEIFEGDYFLGEVVEFLGIARPLIFDFYGQVHSSATFEQCGALLNLNASETTQFLRDLQVHQQDESNITLVTFTPNFEEEFVTFPNRRQNIHDAISQRVWSLEIRAKNIVKNFA